MKSGWPGVSIRLMVVRPTTNDTTAALMVMPRWRSRSRVSVWVLPWSTLPTSSMTPAANSSRSVRVVLPASTWARIPRFTVSTKRSVLACRGEARPGGHERGWHLDLLARAGRSALAPAQQTAAGPATELPPPGRHPVRLRADALDPAPLNAGDGPEGVGPRLRLGDVGGDPAEDGPGVDVGLGPPLPHPAVAVEPGAGPVGDGRAARAIRAANRLTCVVVSSTLPRPFRSCPAPPAGRPGRIQPRTAGSAQVGRPGSTGSAPGRARCASGARGWHTARRPRPARRGCRAR